MNEIREYRLRFRRIRKGYQLADRVSGMEIPVGYFSALFYGETLPGLIGIQNIDIFQPPVIAGSEIVPVFLNTVQFFVP